MRPRPTKPHVARLVPLDAKDLCIVLDMVSLDDAPIPRTHSREGEKRILTAALITALGEGAEQNGEVKLGQGRKGE